LLLVSVGLGGRAGAGEERESFDCDIEATEVFDFRLILRAKEGDEVADDDGELFEDDAGLAIAAAAAAAVFDVVATVGFMVDEAFIDDCNGGFGEELLLPLIDAVGCVDFGTTTEVDRGVGCEIAFGRRVGDGGVGNGVDCVGIDEAFAFVDVLKNDF
jgi:hypothetical protein